MATEPLNTTDYRNAPSGIGPQADQWKDKPHRLIYDLCAEVERLRKEVENMQHEALNAAEYREMDGPCAP